MVIEEGEGDFKERCVIIKGEEKNVEEEAEQADDQQSEQPTETETKPGTSLVTEQETEPETSLATEQETEDKHETISSTSTQDFDREKVKREFINLTLHYQQIGESFKNLVEEVPHIRKCQLASHVAGMPILPMVKVTTEEKVSSMYGQWYEIEEPSKVQEEYNPKVHGESAEKKLQSAINSVGEKCITSNGSWRLCH